MNEIPVQACLNAHGRKFGQKFYAPDDEKTWRLIGVGIWRMVDDPEWWGEPSSPASATAVDSWAEVPRGTLRANVSTMDAELD